MRGFLSKLTGTAKTQPTPARQQRVFGTAPATAAPAPDAPVRTAAVLKMPARQSANDAAGPGNQRVIGSPAPTETNQPEIEIVCGLRFASGVIETQSVLSQLVFGKIINAEIKLSQHFYSRVAIAKLGDNTKECLLFADKDKLNSDDLTAIVEVIRNRSYEMAKAGPQGYWCSSQLVLALSQGHIDANGLAVDRSLAKDPAKNALLNAFTDIVAWAYANNADDLDFVVVQDQPKSQVAFKIGGKYVRPEMFALPTDQLIQMLGIAWQKSSGGASAQFEIRSEQQAKIELELPRGREIPQGARVRLRWSGMANDKGTVVTMRLQRLGDSARIRSLESAGYPRSQMEILMRVTRSEGGMVVFSGVVGSGKSTSLAQLLSILPPDIKMISIEDPVELEIARMYQKTVTRDLTSDQVDPAFLAATRAIFRSALDVLLLGEIRDTTTGLLARQVVESGHSVYTTTHAKGALGVIDRFASPAIGMPREVLATPDILKVLVYQALLPVSCPHCAKSPDDYVHQHQLTGDALDQHRRYFGLIHDLYAIDPSKFRLRDPNGCEHCRGPLKELWGYSGRTVVSEMIEPDEQMLEFILVGNNVALTRYWRSLATPSFEDENLIGKTAMECAILKASQGVIDPREIEGRFMAFETVRAKREISQRRGTA